MTQVALVQEVCSKFTIVQYSELTMLFINLRQQYLPPSLLSPSLPLPSPLSSSLVPPYSLLLTIHRSLMTFDPAIQGLLTELSFIPCSSFM